MYQQLSHVMRWTLVLVFVICWGSLASGFDPLNGSEPVEKVHNPQNQSFDIPAGRQGGETIATAVVIPGLPFEDIGNTANNIHDYDEVCPYEGSAAPDVVYSYTPDTDVLVNIDLCGSLYDTKVYVYENAWTPGNPYACNDDWYVLPDDPCGQYVSKLSELDLYAGNTYYIVVDGYMGAHGEYRIDVHATEPCIVDYPGDPYVLEGEPDFYDGYVDNFNGGCTSDPPVFQHIDWVDETGCAHLWANNGWYMWGDAYQDDVDVFTIVAEGGPLSFTVEIEYYGSWMLVYDVFDCENINIMAFEFIEPCQPTTITWTADPGTEFALVVTPIATLPMTHTYHYTMEVCGHAYKAVPTEDTTWGVVKSLYR